MLALASLLVLASCGGAGGGVGPGRPAPDFTLADLGGASVSLSDSRGKPVLINFFATWCPACREEMPILQAISSEKAADGLVVLIVDIQEDKATVEKFMKEFNYTMRVVMDRDGRVTQRYGVVPIPTTFLVDRQGIIRFVQVGAFRSREELRAKLSMIM